MTAAVKSSAYDVASWTDWGYEETYWLNRIGERTEPCGTPVWRGYGLEVLLLYLQVAVRPRKYVVSHLIVLCVMFVLCISVRSFVWFTVSKALEKSTAIATVRCIG